MAFSEEEIQKVWNDGKAVAGYDPDVWRKDQCGAWIHRMQYGNRKSDYGWEIDHISPGGPDTKDNLRPLQWQNNLSKSDSRLGCKVTSSGKKNVEIKESED
ncbi:MAG TPA: HNH endonuclease signature motif containing protein [Candidatus Acidoferrales bacterium]|nr:HNH endonuclease signature motif containing protein [Candidatus Acidoferrales bacterium]